MTLPTVPTTIEYDDPEGDGFIAFADAPAYTGFIGDWDMDSLVALFTQRSREGILAIQYVGQENCWVTLDIRAEASEKEAVREVSLPITITSGVLWSTNYTDLTMVAQFDKYVLAEEGGTEPVLELENGSYVLTFRYLPAEDDDDEEPNPVELVITPGTCEAPDPFPGGEKLL